ncbi:MAG: hypothetical protein ACRDFB_02075 [Rhabdochlamydiaceae bacterium]
MTMYEIKLEVRKILRAGVRLDSSTNDNFINAIKFYRKETDSDLKEAKMAVEDIGSDIEIFVGRNRPLSHDTDTSHGINEMIKRDRLIWQLLVSLKLAHQKQPYNGPTVAQINFIDETVMQAEELLAKDKF